MVWMTRGRVSSFEFRVLGFEFWVLIFHAAARPTIPALVEWVWTLWGAWVRPSFWISGAAD